MNDFPEMKENLSAEEKRILLKKLLRDKAARKKTSHPLSYGQKALWFLYRSAPGSAAYNVAGVCRIVSLVDIRALRDACRTLIARHPALRSTFSLQDNQPVQIVHGVQEFDFEEIDVSKDTDTELHERVRAAYRSPFHLEKDSPFRVRLFTRAPKDHVLLMASPHIAYDGWSTWILVSELLSLYSVPKADHAATLPPMKWQYQDFVRWQTELLAGPEGKRSWEYWRENLAGELPVLDLPTDRPRPAVQSYNGATLTFNLPAELTRQLNNRTQASNVTLYMMVMAAFQVLLHRYTGQNDIIVGSPTVGRSRAEFQDIVGYFVNTLPMRADFSEDPPFDAFLNQVRETMVNGLGHQDYPFPLLVERLQPQRDASISPIFQALLVMQKIQNDDELSAFVMDAAGDEHVRVDRGGLSLAPFKMPQQEGQFDLTLEIIEAEQSLSNAFLYNPDLFEAETMIRMVGHFQSLLEGIVADPSTRVSELPLLTGQERQRILVEWNDTRVPYPQDECVHELFEQQVRENPDAVALVFADREVSYGELNTRANRLAHRLRALGVGPEILVGVFVERSVEMIVGILAILKSGGAYVPLDLEYPRERLAFMAEDADLKALLCHGATRDRLPECAAQILDLDEEETLKAAEGDSNNLAKLANPDNLAYVIYTSGSTGVPKGVCVDHRSVVRLVRNTNYMEFDETQVFLQSAPIAFDASTFEVWGSLVNGAKLVIPLPGHLSLEELGRYLGEYNVTTLFLTTALFNLIVQERPGDIANLRFLLCGGEVGSPENMKKAAQLLTRGKLLHCYGPTENTTYTTFHTVSTDVDTGRPMPIGGPISNTRIYVLDDRMQLVPVGVTGELYTGGVGVARGYLNRPELTAEKFIPDPFDKEPGARLYRTGDACRWLPDGTIDFLGRIDTQVKVRGFRIECGEVESALLLHPDVREVVVDPRGEGTDKRLVAWLVAQTEDRATLRDALRAHLRQSLPDWMVPSIFVFMDSFPLTPNGKIHRQALPDPDAGDLGSTTEYIAPRTEAEAEMARLWAEVLGVDKVGLHDNFFDLGGHSVLAIQLTSQIKEQLGVEVPIRALFEDPTVLGLLREIGRTQTEEDKKRLDLDAEARLEDDIHPQDGMLIASQVENPGHALITGATGFLGVYLIGELLKQTKAVIWCLVRGENHQEAEKRLETALVEHDQAIDGWQQRVKVVTGDLKQQRLGLTEETFREFSDKIDVIYHNGTEVNHMYPYHELRKANVEGTKEVLKLACTGRKKPVHYVSTAGVFTGTGQPIREDSRLISDGLVENGYIQSKWVAENLIWEAGNRGLPVAVYRPDRIGGHSKTGKWNDKDTFYQMLLACIEWGIFPDWDYVENVAPVDYCAKALVWLSLREQALGRAYHLANSHSLPSNRIASHLRANGFEMRQLPYKEWREEVDRKGKGLLEHLLDYTIGDEGSFIEGEIQELECDRTIQALSESGIECPPITAELIGRYLEAMQLSHTGQSRSR
uniref:Amino acid adenylation domain-containing protein/thioester reductase domain-containing protein n=1 Tax=Candidatus Kentrum sp. LFY TaxID=2126342 RepID=A0A450U5I0_9GAMM|nr:MAG: amino acid adenylation domain-containing protein/thioester reductase domain-containing protein [Candidatus Kentron sp. LFY]